MNKREQIFESESSINENILLIYSRFYMKNYCGRVTIINILSITDADSFPCMVKIVRKFI